jgi:hypothetical protein
MMTLPLVPSLPNYRVGTTIIDTLYLLDVRWNSRDQAWYMDILDSEEAVIRRGIKLVLGTYIGRTSNHPLFRNGVFVVMDRSGEGRDAGLDDMGTRVLVRYYSSDDVVAGLRQARDFNSSIP